MTSILVDESLWNLAQSHTAVLCAEFKKDSSTIDVIGERDFSLRRNSDELFAL